MTFEPTARQLSFVLPASFMKGDLIFKHLTNSFEEIRIAVRPTLKQRHVVSTEKLAKGRWRIGLNWSDGRQQYHDEKEIRID